MCKALLSTSSDDAALPADRQTAVSAGGNPLPGLAQPIGALPGRVCAQPPRAFYPRPRVHPRIAMPRPERMPACLTSPDSPLFPSSSERVTLLDGRVSMAPDTSSPPGTASSTRNRSGTARRHHCQEGEWHLPCKSFPSFSWQLAAARNAPAAQERGKLPLHICFTHARTPRLASPSTSHG